MQEEGGESRDQANRSSLSRQPIPGRPARQICLAVLGGAAWSPGSAFDTSEQSANEGAWQEGVRGRGVCEAAGGEEVAGWPSLEAAFLPT